VHFTRKLLLVPWTCPRHSNTESSRLYQDVSRDLTTNVRKTKREQDRRHWVESSSSCHFTLPTSLFQVCDSSFPVSFFQICDSNFLHFLLPDEIIVFPFFFLLSSAADARGIPLCACFYMVPFLGYPQCCTLNGARRQLCCPGREKHPQRGTLNPYATSSSVQWSDIWSGPARYATRCSVQRPTPLRGGKLRSLHYHCHCLGAVFTNGERSETYMGHVYFL
jgi:hypothetical protein